MASETSYPKEKMKILLLEKIHPAAGKKFRESGYNVQEIGRALSAEEMLTQIEDAHVVCIRSKSRITAEQLQHAKRLLVVGCFGVGTNQVALNTATSSGVAVFNAPFSSTRSVAELAVADMLMLARRLGDANSGMHRQRWQKSAKGSFELRNKVVGVVGYGHIGEQVGLLAEAIGLRVIFYDQAKRLPLGNARGMESLEALLGAADFVTLHVPSQRGSTPLIGERELQQMKHGAYLLNLGRGNLVDLTALKQAILAGQLAGAALDVYPREPESNDAEFPCELAGLPNVILTPHIGGSTEEAQYNIALEVTDSLIGYVETGSTLGAVNFPQVNLPPFPNSHRILNIHRNEPGVLSEVNRAISEIGANIDSQYLSTYQDIGYLIMDVNRDLSQEVKERIAKLPSSVKTRMLY